MRYQGMRVWVVRSGWDVTVYTPTSTSGFQDFPWNSSARRAVSHANVPILSYSDNFTLHFPGTPDDDFALTATSTVSAEAGHRQFCTSSDDGSWLYVDGGLLINNQGLHASQTVCQYIELSAGIHSVAVRFFEHTGAASLEVSMDGSPIGFRDGTPPAQRGPAAFSCVLGRKDSPAPPACSMVLCRYRQTERQTGNTTENQRTA
jgi:hypothetical protein